MRYDRRTVLAFGLVGTSAAAAETMGPRVGAAAPGFSVRNTEGHLVSSKDLIGKIIVLEWTNPECPYVNKHYSSGSMQALQRAAASNGIVWLSISSAAPGNMGYIEALEAAELMAVRNAAPTYLLLDHDGTMQTAYGVHVALTMAVIDARGMLAYFGAIDDKPTSKPSDISGARNYVRGALAALAAGEPVTPAQTRPYGCAAR